MGLLRLVLPGWMIFVGINACAQADSGAPVTMHYFERKPLHYLDQNNHVSGILVAPIEQAFSKAGVPLVWQQTPINRILATLKNNDGRDCAAGWYKSSEREAFARFSLPIYRDRGIVVLARADFPGPALTSAHELLSRPQTRLLLKQGFVHGRYLDPLIDKMPQAQVQRVSDEMSSMVRMVRVGVADIMIMTEEEVEVYANPATAAGDGTRVLHLSDVPPREYRYLACSRQVPQQVMDKLNAAIATLPQDSLRAP